MLEANQTVYTLRTVMLDFDELVLPFWHNFTVTSPIYHYIVGIFIGFVGLAGIFLNSAAIFIYATSKALRTPPNLLIINLAISDLLFSAVNGFPLKTLASFNHYWMWGKFACDIYGFASGLFGFLSLTTISLIAWDRYTAIKKPFQSVFQRNYKRSLISLAILWLWSATWPSPPLFKFGRYVLEGYQTSCTFDFISIDLPNRLFNGGLFVFGFLCPVLISIYCYVNIVIIIRRNGQEFIKFAKILTVDHKKPHFKENITGKNGKLELETTKSAAILLILYLICWIPYAFIAFLSVLGKQDHLTPELVELPCLFAKTAAIYDPCIYALRHPKFKLAIRKKYPFLYTLCSGKRRPYNSPKRVKLSIDQIAFMANECSQIQNFVPICDSNEEYAITESQQSFSNNHISKK